MELEELSPTNLVGPQQDVEPIAAWADRNGVTCGTARAWVYRGIIPSVKLGKLRIVNSALLRRGLVETVNSLSPRLPPPLSTTRPALHQPLPLPLL